MHLISTIGYEGSEIERFTATLIGAGIRQLADVREVALSRKKGFSKTALRLHLHRAGIEYLHFRNLGDPKAGREAARNGKHQLFRSIYLQHLDGGNAQEALASLATVAAGEATCMMCFERNPAECHRTLIGERLGLLGFSINHLFVNHDHFHSPLGAGHPGGHSRQGTPASQ